MKCFDPYLKADALQGPDLDNLAYFGVERVVLISHAPRSFANERDLTTYWEELLEREVPRFARHGITAHVALGVHPLASPRRTAPGLLRKLGALVSDERVVGIGELTIADDLPAQWSLLERQIALVEDLPLMFRVTGELKINTTYKIANLLTTKNIAPARACFCLDDISLAETMLEDGFSVMLSVGPLDLGAREVGEHVLSLIDVLGEAVVREQLMFTSAARDGAGDVLALARAVQSLERAGLASALIARLVYENAAARFGA